MKSRKSFLGFASLFFVIIGTVFVQAYSENNGNLLHIYQGWNSKDSKQAWSQYEGSQIMPAKWFDALEAFDSTKKFKSTLEKFGLISVSPYELPIGLTFAEDHETAWWSHQRFDMPNDRTLRR